MKTRKTSRHVVFALVLAIGLTLLLPLELSARVGGGHSYSGGGGGGGGNGGDGGSAGAIIWLVFQAIRLLVFLTVEYPVIGIPLDIIVIGGIAYFFVRRTTGATTARQELFSSAGVTSIQSAMDVCAEPESIARQFNQLRKFDPNFSEIVFTDFAYALYGKAHEARGRGVAAVDEFSPYLSAAARNSLLQRNPPSLAEVKGVIVGSMQVAGISGLETPMVAIALLFEANYTEVVRTGAGMSEMSYYVRERWELERKRDVLSPPPAKATALHCPRCGAPLQKDSVGACAFCRTKIDSGDFQWYVRKITLLSKEAKGPLLTSDVAEVGTDLPSVVQLNLVNVRSEFERNNPAFSWSAFEERARLIFNELQAAWSNLDWERARPHETDNIFQMHQYWIDAYRKQGLRNVLDQAAVSAMQPVKIKEDAYYHAITLRIWGQGYDYTVDQNGRVVSGSKTNLRRWTEYWTFIRNRQAKPAAAQTSLNCPNCGAPLKVNATGICEFCGGKITSGEFDWVLSKIEQDESYSG